MRLDELRDQEANKLGTSVNHDLELSNFPLNSVLVAITSDLIQPIQAGSIQWAITFLR